MSSFTANFGSIENTGPGVKVGKCRIRNAGLENGGPTQHLSYSTLCHIWSSHAHIDVAHIHTQNLALSEFCLQNWLTSLHGKRNLLKSFKWTIITMAMANTLVMFQSIL